VLNSNLAANARFCKRAVVLLHWAGWNDEYVVFDEASGQTHQLDAVRAYVLNLLTEGPHSLADIRRALAQDAAPAADAIGDEILHTILGEFESHGLVEVIAQ
jgi:PqqD family protein of HPr-rel-A system